MSNSEAGAPSLATALETARQLETARRLAAWVPDDFDYELCAASFARLITVLYNLDADITSIFRIWAWITGEFTGADLESAVDRAADVQDRARAAATTAPGKGSLTMPESGYAGPSLAIALETARRLVTRPRDFESPQAAQFARLIIALYDLGADNGNAWQVLGWITDDDTNPEPAGDLATTLQEHARVAAAFADAYDQDSEDGQDDKDTGAGEKHRTLDIEVWADPDATSPAEADGWRLFSFSHKHASFRRRDNLPDLSAELADGRAFRLSYFEHGDCAWMLQGAPKVMFGGDWRYDGVNYAGVLIWEGDPAALPESREARKRDAAAFIAEYTCWANGEGYGYTVTNAGTGDDIGSCGDYLGMEAVLAAIFASGLVREDDVIARATLGGDDILDEVRRAREAASAPGPGASPDA